MSKSEESDELFSLRFLLASLYDNSDEVRETLLQAGLDVPETNIHGPALVVWERVIGYAVQNNKVNELIEAVAKRHPSHAENLKHYLANTSYEGNVPKGRMSRESNQRAHPIAKPVQGTIQTFLTEPEVIRLVNEFLADRQSMEAWTFAEDGSYLRPQDILELAWVMRGHGDRTRYNAIWTTMETLAPLCREHGLSAAMALGVIADSVVRLAGGQGWEDIIFNYVEASFRDPPCPSCGQAGVKGGRRCENCWGVGARLP